MKKIINKCSFCDINTEENSCLIQGKGDIFICIECAKAVMEIFEDEDKIHPIKKEEFIEYKHDIENGWRKLKIMKSLFKIIPRDLIYKYNILPISMGEGALMVYSPPGSDLDLIASELKIYVKVKIGFLEMPIEVIEGGLKKVYSEIDN